MIALVPITRDSEPGGRPVEGLAEAAGRDVTSL